jgi:magnesium chelatase family protein
MQAAMTQLNLSARAYPRTQSAKLSRTIADLAGSEEIQSVHLAEALQYRSKLMMGKFHRYFVLVIKDLRI